ncbi:MAG: molybdenum cofactor biosynthesis protein MoaE [Bacteroidales bacterium]|nr:molybdenum cofactor biosynthesis protein MoaE [Bacteroidales bacterium]
MNELVLVEGPVPGSLVSSMADAPGGEKEHGAHTVFLGRVRADIRGSRKVKAIEYSAYREMTLKVVAEIRNHILSKYSDVGEVVIVHSTGIVMAGEISLLVFISAGHRRQAMDACSETVELIKEKLPVWKKEIFGDNTHEWVDNKQA